MKSLILVFLFLLINGIYCFAQKVEEIMTDSLQFETNSKNSIIKFGIGSYYASKFQGCKTANGEIYQKDKYTAACNVLPLNTWIKVTNLKNNKWVIVKINDRLHRKNKRLLDLSFMAATELDYIKMGISKIKIEVLKNYILPKDGNY